MTIDELEALDKQGTPEPWDTNKPRPGNPVVATTRDGACISVRHGQLGVADGPLIAAMRNHFKRLLAVARAAEKMMRARLLEEAQPEVHIEVVRAWDQMAAALAALEQVP